MPTPCAPGLALITHQREPFPCCRSAEPAWAAQDRGGSDEEGEEGEEEEGEEEGEEEEGEEEEEEEGDACDSGGGALARGGASGATSGDGLAGQEGGRGG